MGARGTALIAPLALSFALTVSPPAARIAAAQQSRDQVLPGCGICYPGGYDVNTVGEVSGTILNLQAPDEGPVRLLLVGDRERWVVLASPAWFWKSARQRPLPGDVVIVRGSKTLGADGTLYVIAREIRPSRSAPVVLRDRRGAPLWNGGRRGAMPGAKAGAH